MVVTDIVPSVLLKDEEDVESKFRMCLVEPKAHRKTLPQRFVCVSKSSIPVMAIQPLTKETEDLSADLMVCIVTKLRKPE